MNVYCVFELINNPDLSGHTHKLEDIFELREDAMFHAEKLRGLNPGCCMFITQGWPLK